MTAWNELVQRGRSAKERLGQAKFDLGDLADEVDTSWGGGQLQKYADEIEIEYKTLCDYRTVARAWGSSERSEKAPWSVYQMLTGRDDRHEILAEQERWTVAQMRARLNKRQNYYSQDDHGEAARRARDLPAEERAALVREALNDPEVAEQVSEQITDYVADDANLTTKVVQKRQKAQPAREPEPRQARDYDALVEKAVSLLSDSLAAESSQRWVPNSTSRALLYFLTQVLGDRQAPTGEQADLVNEKLESLFAEVEAFANSEAAS
jgi:hypothetical protein